MADNSWMYGNPDVVKQYQQNIATRPVPTYTPAPDAASTPHRSGLLKFLPAAGAVAGGLIAAPFTGGLSLAATLAALGGGAALGGAFGEGGAEALSHEKLNPGKIAKEGLVSGVTGAIPFGGVARGAKIAKGVADAGAAQVAKDSLATKALKFTEASGTKMRTRSAGIGLGDKIAGESPLSVADQNAVTKTLQRFNTPSGSVEKQARHIDTKLEALRPQLDKVVEAANKPINTAGRKLIADDIRSTVGSRITMTDNQKKILNGIIDQFTHVKNDVGLLKAKREIYNEMLNFAKNPDAANTDKEAVFKIAGRAFKDALDKRVPGSKGLNKDFADLSTANRYLLNASAKANSASRTGGGGGLFATLTKGDIAQAAKNYYGTAQEKVAQKGLGALGQGADTAVANPTLARTAIGETGKQVFGQPAVGGALSLAGALAGVSGGDNSQTYLDPNATAGATDPGATTTGTTPEQIQPAYTLEQAMKDAQANPKQAAQFLAYAKESTAEAAAANKANAPGKAHGIVSAQMSSNATNGLSALSQLRQLLSSDKGAISRANVPGQSLPLIGGYVAGKLNTSQYNNLAATVADMYLRVTTGATANASEIKNIKQNILPKAGDSPAAVHQKLTNLEAFFQRVTGSQVSDPNASLTDALSQALQGAGTPQ